MSCHVISSHHITSILTYYTYNSTHCIVVYSINLVNCSSHRLAVSLDLTFNLGGGATTAAGGGNGKDGRSGDNDGDDGGDTGHHRRRRGGGGDDDDVEEEDEAKEEKSEEKADDGKARDVKQSTIRIPRLKPSSGAWVGEKELWLERPVVSIDLINPTVPLLILSRH